MPTLWMLEDTEPWPDEPAVGEVCRPTTFWASPERMDLPAEVCTDVPARIEGVTVDGRTERVAHLGDGLTTVVNDDEPLGDVMLHGALLWDRYLWSVSRMATQGSVRVLDRPGFLGQYEEREATRYAEVFSVTPLGQMKYYERGFLSESYGIQWKVLLVETVDLGR